MIEQAQIVRWEDPPPPSGKGGRNPGTPSSRYTTVADELRARPGDWAVIERFAGRRNNGLATKVAMGAMLCFTPAGDFEARTRHRNGEVLVYARYLGDGGES